MLKVMRKYFFTQWIWHCSILIFYIAKKWKQQNVKSILFRSFESMQTNKILETVCLPDYQKRGRISAGNAPGRLQAKQWGHFPRNIPPTNAKKNPQRRCVVCAKHKKRSETTWECKKCLIALHIPSCFEKYHTLQDY